MPLESYGDLAPPSAGIVQETIRSFRKGIEGLEDCEHHMMYNEPIEGSETEGSKEYRENLNLLANDMENVRIHTRENKGLGPALEEGLEIVNTPLVLLLNMIGNYSIVLKLT